jgi:hypothetical protein
MVKFVAFPYKWRSRDPHGAVRRAGISEALVADPCFGRLVLRIA